MKATRLGIEEIRRARPVVAEAAIRTPLVRLNVGDAPAEIYLKLENLQPIGSFKIRGAANAMSGMSKAELAKGVFVASAGNMAQGAAWNARRLGIPCTVIAPDYAPDTKLKAIERLGGRVVSDHERASLLTSSREGTRHSSSFSVIQEMSASPSAGIRPLPVRQSTAT